MFVRGAVRGMKEKIPRNLNRSRREHMVERIIYNKTQLLNNCTPDIFGVCVDDAA
jgi:hypothetical protein